MFEESAASQQETLSQARAYGLIAKMDTGRVISREIMINESKTMQKQRKRDMKKQRNLCV